MLRLTINIAFGVGFGITGYLLYNWVGSSNLKQEYIPIAYGISYFFMLGSALSVIQSFVLYAKSGNSKQQSENNKSSSYIEELQKLGELKEKGLLTEDEFNKEKQKLLKK